MNKPDKETLAKLRKAAGHGYCPGVIALLRTEYNHTVEKKQEVYDVVHGKKSDDTIMQAFLTYVIRKSKASAPINSLVNEALRAISSAA